MRHSILHNLPAINLETAVNELQRRDYSGQLNKVMKDGLEVMSSIYSLDEQLIYAIRLANHVAESKNYTVRDLAKLHIKMQEIALSRLEQQACNGDEALHITHPDYLFQSALRNLLEAGLKRAEPKELSSFIGIYMFEAASFASGSISNHEPNEDSELRRKTFLGLQKEEFIEAYLHKVERKDNEFYFNRFKALIDYVVRNKNYEYINQLTSQVGYQNRETNIIAALAVPLQIEVRDQTSFNNLLDLYESIHRGLDRTADAPAHSVLQAAADEVGRAFHYHVNRYKVSQKLAAYLNQRTGFMQKEIREWKRAGLRADI